MPYHAFSMPLFISIFLFDYFTLSILICCFSDAACWCADAIFILMLPLRHFRCCRDDFAFWCWCRHFVVCRFDLLMLMISPRLLIFAFRHIDFLLSLWLFIFDAMLSTLMLIFSSFAFIAFLHLSIIFFADAFDFLSITPLLIFRFHFDCCFSLSLSRIDDDFFWFSVFIDLCFSLLPQWFSSIIFAID